MTAGASKAATTITQPALAPSPQPRPAPTARALPPKPVAQRGQNWTPIRGQICAPIDSRLAAIDMFVVVTATFRLLYALIVLGHDRRRVIHFEVTENPTQDWLARQM